MVNSHSQPDTLRNLAPELRHIPLSKSVISVNHCPHVTSPCTPSLCDHNRYLRDASDLALLAVTGSMLEDNVKDLKALLDAVKGASAPLCAIQPLEEARALPPFHEVKIFHGAQWRAGAPGRHACATRAASCGHGVADQDRRDHPERI